MIDLRDMACCAVQEMAWIGDDQPEQVIEDLCEDLYGRKADREPGSYYSVYDRNIEDKPSGFYIFTAIVGYTNNKAKEKYGPQLAAYIKKHKLGTVTASVTATNRVNHPTHKIKVYTWAPNARNLKAWWGKYQKDGKA